MHVWEGEGHTASVEVQVATQPADDATDDSSRGSHDSGPTDLLKPWIDHPDARVPDQDTLSSHHSLRRPQSL
jgi:hypothetical protein